MIFGGFEILGQSDERRRDFFGSQKKQRDFFCVVKKGLRDFFGYAKKTSDFFGQTNSGVVIFLGIKYEPLPDPPPPPPHTHTPVIKICEWGPWDMTATFEV